METKSMRHLLIISTLIIVVSCRQKNSDSTTTRDTTNITSNDSAGVDKGKTNDNFTLHAIEQKDSIESKVTARTLLDSVFHLIDNFEKRKLHLYELTWSTDGYEYNSNSTYYFDSLMQLECVQESWQQEGTSGSKYYFSEKNHLLAFYQEEQSGSDIVHVSVAKAGNRGLSFEKETGQNDSIQGIKELDDRYLLSAESKVENQLEKLVDLIKERKKKGNEEFISISKSEEVAIGTNVNFTQTTTVTLRTELYKALVKRQKKQ